MTFITVDAVKQPLKLFKSFDVDTQLALLWFDYNRIKENLTPSPNYETENIVDSLCNRFERMSEEEQLQAMRNIAQGADAPISREYTALSPSAKLDIWLKLAQGMENGTIVGYPESYQLPDGVDEYNQLVQSLSFEERINLVRNAIANMGYRA